MKLTVALFAILAVFGLGQAHQVPNFGKGPLHEDLQDFLDLIPMQQIAEVFVYYVEHDREMQEFGNYISTTNVTVDIWKDYQEIDEVINFFNYLHDKDIEIYNMVNAVNRALNIKELVPPSDVPMREQIMRETGGLVGFFSEVKKLLDQDAFVSLYANKIRYSPVFNEFIRELKSDNFYHAVNKVYRVKGVQSVLNVLKQFKVNTKIVADYLYVLLGLKVEPKTLEEEIYEFYELLPWEELVDVMVSYINEDEKVRQAVMFLFESEFHELVRAVESLKEFDEFVLYFERNSDLPVIEGIQQFHELIGMEGYVPPKVENILKYVGKSQKVGEGMVALIKDIYALLPLEKIDALYEQKLATPNSFSKFVKDVTSEEMVTIATNLFAKAEAKQFVVKSKEKGLELEGLAKLNARMLGLYKNSPVF